MSLKIQRDGKGVIRARFNTPLIKDMYNFDAKNDESKTFLDNAGIRIDEDEAGMRISMPLGLMDHIMGLGEKAFPVERKRTKVEFWNYDSYAYNLKADPLYVSIPFFLKISGGKSEGFFVNYGGRMWMDFGQEIYDRVVITVPSKDFEFYIFPEAEPVEVLRQFITLTGKPFTMPEWALEHQISRYSYYPDTRIVEILEMYQKTFGKDSVGTVYLDIDYMKDYAPFTIDSTKFSDIRSFTDKCHSMGTRVIPIIDPGLKVDQRNEIFLKGMGNYIETSKGEIFTSNVWPGKCAFPDFISSGGRSFWNSQISAFMKDGFDGIWLDMNEPSMNSQSRTIDEDALHDIEGRKVEHSRIHNYYAYYEAKATREALGKDNLILSRSGFAGIQQYAAVWSGDGNGNFKSMALQIPLLASLSISGIPYVGCDLGGFLEYTDPEILLRFYQMALFFPIYRNHKSKTENDQELYLYNSYFVDRFREILSLRHSIVPHLLWKARLAEENFEPVIRPVAFNYPHNDGLFQIDDQYMVGTEIMVAPIIHRNMESRKVFLPEGRWYNLQTGEINMGDRMVNSGGDIPVYLKENSVLLTRKGLVAFGRIKEKIFHEGKWIEIEHNTGSTETSENKKMKIMDVEKERITIRDLL